MQHEVVARAGSERGEVIVRRRTDGALELRVNGIFVMDTVETSTERLLARAALDGAAEGTTDGPPPRRVLVGGLGLGFTVRELLADPRVEEVVVAEIEPAVVAWMREGTLPGTDLFGDRRVTVLTGDIRDLTPSLATASLDAVLLDVDNGPGHLVHATNDAIYTHSFLHDCRRLLRSGGRLTVWSAAASPDLAETMTSVFGACRTRAVPVELQGRDESYWLYSSGATVAQDASRPVGSP